MIAGRRSGVLHMCVIGGYCIWVVIPLKYPFNFIYSLLIKKNISILGMTTRRILIHISEVKIYIYLYSCWYKICFSSHLYLVVSKNVHISVFFTFSSFKHKRLLVLEQFVLLQFQLLDFQ